MSEFFQSLWPNEWAAPQWVLPGVILGGVLILLAIWSWTRGRVSATTGIVGALVKIAAIIILVLILLEPMRSETRPEPGANLFLVMADNSQSLGIRDAGEDQTRGEFIERNTRPNLRVASAAQSGFRHPPICV